MKTVSASITFVLLVLVAGFIPQSANAIAAGTGCHMADYACYNGYSNQSDYVRCMDFYGCFALPWTFAE